jgi:hypothetical protein
MRFSGLLLVIVCVGLVVLAAMNPQPDDFQRFAAEQLESRIQTEVRDRTGGRGSALGNLLAGAGADLADRYVERATDRTNYLVASTYTVDLDGPSGDELEWTFLGIGGRFVPLDGPKLDGKNDGGS